MIMSSASLFTNLLSTSDSILHISKESLYYVKFNYVLIRTARALCRTCLQSLWKFLLWNLVFRFSSRFLTYFGLFVWLASCDWWRKLPPNPKSLATYSNAPTGIWNQVFIDERQLHVASNANAVYDTAIRAGPQFLFYQEPYLNSHFIYLKAMARVVSVS